MDKSTLLLLAITLAVFGVSVTAGHPAWGTITGVAIILLAAGLAAGTLPLDSRDYFEERIGPSQRISTSLVTLSSAAIVAIYALGYHRTSPRTPRLGSEIPRERTAASATSVTPPTAANPTTDAAPPVPPSVAPGVGKNSRRPSTSTGKVPPTKPADSTPQARYKDGVYLAWGSCPHGDIEVSVSIEGGKIAATAISQCLTRYSCSWIAPRTPGGGLPDLPGQVVRRQSPRVDYVSGATESSYAFADAVARALAKASE